MEKQLWYWLEKNKVKGAEPTMHGPFSIPEIYDLRANGTINEKTFLWQERNDGQEDSWEKLKRIPKLLAALKAEEAHRRQNALRNDVIDSVHSNDFGSGDTSYSSGHSSFEDNNHRHVLVKNQRTYLGGFEIDDTIRVYSKSLRKWCYGRVLEFQGDNRMMVEYSPSEDNTTDLFRKKVNCHSSMVHLIAHQRNGASLIKPSYTPPMDHSLPSRDPPPPGMFPNHRMPPSFRRNGPLSALDNINSSNTASQQPSNTPSYGNVASPYSFKEQGRRRKKKKRRKVKKNRFL